MKKAVFMILLVLAFFTSNVFGGTETWHGDKLTHIYGYNKGSCDPLLADSPIFPMLFSNKGEVISFAYAVTPMDPSYNMNVDRSIAPRFWHKGKDTNLAVITVYQVGDVSKFRLNFVKFNDRDQLTFEFISAVDGLDAIYWTDLKKEYNSSHEKTVPITAIERNWVLDNDAKLIQSNSGGNTIINIWSLPNGRTKKFEHTIAISPVWFGPNKFNVTLVRTR